jgi:hypothetical protein
MIETLLIILVVGALCIGCFLIGAKVGQAVSKGETIELPSVNPLEAYRKHEAKREAEKEQNKIDTILQNIECYDGTGKGQKDV